VGVDMFPHTQHVETVVLMSRKKNKCQKVACFRAFSEVGMKALTPEKARLFYMATYLLRKCVSGCDLGIR